MGSPVWSVAGVNYTTKDQPAGQVKLTTIDWRVILTEGTKILPPPGPKTIPRSVPEFVVEKYGTVDEEPNNKTYASMSALQAVTANDFVQMAKDNINDNADDNILTVPPTYTVAQIEHMLENEIELLKNPIVGRHIPS